jgi:DNA-directed RNA polymerase specialized sigma24 family protein
MLTAADRNDVEQLEIAAPAPDDELLALNDLLERLASADSAKAQLVKLRHFAGMTLEAAAAALAISEPTAMTRRSRIRPGRRST